MNNLVFLMFLSFIILAACASAQGDKKASTREEILSAEAQLLTPEDKKQGTVSFEETKKGIKVVINITGLKPKSVHGIHIHENKECKKPDFESAGEHLNPDSLPHGGPEAAKKHPGDFGNVVADAQGIAKKEIIIKRQDLEGIHEIMGKPVVLHSGPDDLVSQPSGDSGKRIACGLII